MSLPTISESEARKPIIESVEHSFRLINACVGRPLTNWTIHHNKSVHEVLTSMQRIVDGINWISGKTPDDLIDKIAAVAQLALVGLDLTVGVDERLRRISEFPNLLYDKHLAYGARSLRRWKRVGLTVFIDTKIGRLIELSQGAPVGRSEPMADSWCDIIGYCALAVALVHDGSIRPHSV